MPISVVSNDYIPFSCNTSKIQPLVSILCVNTVRVDRAGHVIFLHDYTIVIYEGFCNHVEPTVSKTLCFFLVAITLKTNPSKNLLRSPSATIYINSRSENTLRRNNRTY